MRVEDLNLERRGQTVRASARVTWEESDRPALALYFESDAGTADDISPEPAAFLTAVALPALRHGERRITIDGAVCPRLRDGLRTAMAIVKSWRGSPGSVLEIEPKGGFRPGPSRAAPRAAACVGGGVDGLHMLRRNLLEFPRDHPFAFQELYTVVGLLAPDAGRDAELGSHFVRTRETLSKISSAVGLRATIVSTNVFKLDADLVFLRDVWCSAAILSAAHAFPERWSAISIASAGRNQDILYPTGTHPLIDSSYSSSSLEVRHEGACFSRLERIREIVVWNTALENLVVCMNAPPSPFLNCGVCEKCLRTMAELEAVGRLGGASQFPAEKLRAEAISEISIPDFAICHWEEILGPLRARGREDLAEAIDRKLQEAAREGRGWKSRLSRLDRRLLGGALRSLRRRLRDP